MTIEGKGKFVYTDGLGILDWIPKGKQRPVDGWPVRPDTEEAAMKKIGTLLAGGWLP